jgi:uroporphyrinogen III methyltransferase/synthase
LTHRQHASAVAFVTGQEDLDKDAAPLDYAALAGFPGTLVFYMGVTTARHWSAQLLAAGKPPDTPVVVVRRCSFPDQRLEFTCLGDVADRVEQSPRIRPPAIVIVGPVAASRASASWFEQRPLFGQRVLVTRPHRADDPLGQLLAELGADVLYQPAIEITPPRDWAVVDRALSRLNEFDWLVFSSAHGVRHLLDRLLATGRDLRALGSIRLAAIGTGTAEVLRQFHLRADLLPEEFRAEALAEALGPQASGQRFLLARASRGREVLSEQLRAAGATVEQVVVYESVDVTQADQHVTELLGNGQIHWVTVTSSAIAHSLVRLFGEKLRQSRLVSISPVTSGTLRGLGYSPAVEAEPYTMEGVVAAILRGTGAI